MALAAHWFAGLVHHLGHAWAARRTGFPMSGIHCRLFLCASRYPRHEPMLPANVHIRRALGGPLFSFLLAVVVGALTALLPLGFTDGSTLLKWWPQRDS